MIDEPQPVLFCECFCKQRGEEGPGVGACVEVQRVKVLYKLRVLTADNLINSLANGEWLCWVHFEPDLHPLYNERHDQFKYKQVVIWNDFEEREDDLG